ncbi:MAG: Ig-like domain-containing protein [Candidatus Shapirobacteria bacterium]|nr:Ig-like domain-containing protein [Candidatus Shapirobacteria bacterium]
MIRLTVFLLDGRGLGVGNQTINLKLPSSVTINNQQEITDQSGKAFFDISSSTAQTINVTATTNNLTLPQKIRVVFY